MARFYARLWNNSAMITKGIKQLIAEAEQRVRWFKRGMDSGQPKDCNTFSANPL